MIYTNAAMQRFLANEHQVQESQRPKPHNASAAATLTKETGTFPDGDVYEYQLKDGKLHGKMTVTTPAGHVLVTKHKDGKRHGKETLTLPSGDVVVSKYKDGEIMHGKVTLACSDGHVLVGHVKDGSIHCKQTTTSPDGNASPFQDPIQCETRFAAQAVAERKEKERLACLEAEHKRVSAEWRALKKQDRCERASRVVWGVSD